MPEGLLSEPTIRGLTEGASGPFCTKLFANYCARVIKIERACARTGRAHLPSPQQRCQLKRGS